MANKPFNAKLAIAHKGKKGAPAKKQTLPPGVETAKKALHTKGKKKSPPPEKK
jgi:hypothetical protein